MIPNLGLGGLRVAFVVYEDKKKPPVNAGRGFIVGPLYTDMCQIHERFG